MSVAIPSLRGAIAVPEWAKNELWRKAEAAPSLDLRFADSKSLVDATTSTNLIDFTRASSGTYVGSDGLIKTATTNEPRFDHDPATGESLGLLVEEQRTNLVLNSSSATSGSVIGGAVADTVSNVIAPDGQTYTVRRVSFPSQGAYRFGDITSGTAGTTYTGSVWMRTESGTANVLLDVNNAPQGVATVTEDWKRFEASGVSATQTYRFFDISAGSGQVVYLWGAQLEEGSDATSYIENVDNPLGVTRAADVASITGTNFSSWYRQDEGTVFVDFNVEGVYRTSGYNRGFVFSDSASADAFTLLQLGANAKFYESWLINGSQNMNFNTFDISYGKTIRYSSAYKQNDFRRYALDVNNTLDSNTDTSIDVGSFTADSLFIGVEKTGFSQLNGHIRRLTYWPQRLSDATLQTITQ